MKTYTIARTSELKKKDRELIIDLTLRIRFETEDERIHFIEKADVNDTLPPNHNYHPDQVEEIEMKQKVKAFFEKNKLDGVLVDDMTEVGD